MYGIIDTGAKFSLISKKLATMLDLPIKGKTIINTADGKDVDAEVVSLKISLHAKTENNMKAYIQSGGEVNLVCAENQPITLMLIGSDILFEKWGSLQINGKEATIKMLPNGQKKVRNKLKLIQELD